MRMPSFAIIALSVLMAASSVHAALPPDSPFSLVWEKGPIELPAGGSFELPVTIRIPEGHYIYADEMDIDFTSLEGLFVTDIRFPRPKSYEDPHLHRRVDIHQGEVTLVIEGRVPEGLEAGRHELVAKVTFRGCSPKICYRTEQRDISFDIEVVPPAAGTPSKAPAMDDLSRRGEPSPSSGWSVKGLLGVRDFGVLVERGWVLAILIVFLAGVMTSLTPCLWPVLPVVLIYVGVHPHKRFWENLLLAALLTSGLILVYAAMGVAAVALGKNLGFLFQQRAFLALVVLFFLVMSLAMFGVFDMRMPRRLQRRLHRLGGEGYRGAFLAGMGMGLMASPCSGPIIAALLGYVALQRSYAEGFVLLVVYGAGMGLFLTVLAAGCGELIGRLRSGPWMLWVRRVLGVILLFPAAFYMGSLFRWGGEPALGPRDKPGMEWLDSERDALRFAAETGRPVMVEFTANWCPPCRALDRKLFARDDIVQMSYRLVPLRVDATIETREVRRLINKYGVMGWPTVVFLDPSGRLYRDLRVGDYDPDAIERGMREAIERTGEGP